MLAAALHLATPEIATSKHRRANPMPSCFKIYISILKLLKFWDNLSVNSQTQTRIRLLASWLRRVDRGWILVLSRIACSAPCGGDGQRVSAGKSSVGSTLADYGCGYWCLGCACVMRARWRRLLIRASPRKDRLRQVRMFHVEHICSVHIQPCAHIQL